MTCAGSVFTNWAHDLQPSCHRPLQLELVFCCTNNYSTLNYMHADNLVSPAAHCKWNWWSFPLRPPTSSTYYQLRYTFTHTSDTIPPIPTSIAQMCAHIKIKSIFKHIPHHMLHVTTCVCTLMNTSYYIKDRCF